MFLLLASTMCAGLFCGASLYVNLVEHPARMSCGQELAVREFAPSYRRATIMQVSLALVGLVLGLVAAWQLHWQSLPARDFQPIMSNVKPDARSQAFPPILPNWRLRQNTPGTPKIWPGIDIDIP